MMNNNALLACSLLALPVTAAAQSEAPAQLSMYVFRGGAPLEDVLLYVEGQNRARSDANGAMHLTLEKGAYQATLRLGDKVLETLQLKVSASERVQLIVTEPGTDRSGIQVESSLTGSVSSAPNGAAAAADTGVMRGRVISLEGNVPIPGAKVYFSGVSEPVLTDEDGRFEASVPENRYSVSVIHPDFSTRTLTRVDISGDAPVERDVSLSPAALQLSEVVVTAPYLEGGFAALVDEQRNTANVAEVIGAEQMSRSGDSSAAGALKRVTGLTVADGKYIYVRGLGERYSSTTLNGASLPSPEVARRVVPLDLFPTGVLGSIVVQKTYSPDVSGDFAGGIVKLKTRGLPREKVRKLSVTLGGNSESTLKEGLTYEGGSRDLIGMDDGTRAMPDRLSELTDGGSGPLYVLSESEVERAGESLPNNYATESVVLPPDVGFKLNMANRNEAYMGNWGWGYNFALGYKNQWRKRSEESATFGLSGGELVQQDASILEKTENEVFLGGMLNLTAEIGNNHQLESTTLVTRKSTNTVTLDNRYSSENDRYFRETTLEWVERELLSQQFSGTHEIYSLNDLQVDWHATHSRATRDKPDRRFYRYELDQNRNEYALADDSSNERTFEELTDVTNDWGLDLTLPIYNLFSAKAELKAGVAHMDKDRESSLARFRFDTKWDTNDIDRELKYADNPEAILSAENIDANGFFLRNYTFPSDNYTAEQTLDAVYFMGKLYPIDDLEFMAGARQEDSYQKVSTFDLLNPAEKKTAILDTTDTLPAASVKWQFTDKQQVRAAFSKTLNRPEIKELSEAAYLDPDRMVYVRGNPDLQPASIENYDLRWEWYLTPFETTSAAVFYKRFDQPIERVIILGGGGVHTFANAESAENFGVEFQSRFWLSRLFGRGLSNYYFESNLSLIDSEVSLGDAGAQQTTDNRPLQGQAPWIVNATLGYEYLINETEAALLFNMSGERIDSVGVKGLPDAYEQPVPTLDLVYGTRLWLGSEEEGRLKLKLKNILDPTFEITRGDAVERSYKKGISLSATYTYKWK